MLFGSDKNHPNNFVSNGEPPAAMMAVYEYLHKRDIERAENVGVVQGLYKR